MKAAGKHIHLTGVEDPLLYDLAMALHAGGAHVTCSASAEAASAKAKEISGLKLQSPFSEKNVPSTAEWLVRASHVPENNPEVASAQKRGIQVLSVPRFITWISEDQQRIVVAGNTDRHTIIDFIVRVLESARRSFDYSLLQPCNGRYVRLSDAPLIIIEGGDGAGSGDSPADFLSYKHHIAVISGISGGANGAPQEEYVRNFDLFADSTPKAGCIVYNEADSMADVICAKERADVQVIPFKPHPAEEQGGHIVLTSNGGRHPAKGVTRNDLASLSAAREVLRKVGISPEQFYSAFS